MYQAVEEQWDKASAQVRQLLHALRPYQPECVYLFGSWARGEADELSDPDVVLIKPTTQPFFERWREARRLVPAALGGVDLLVSPPEACAAMRRAGNACAEMIVAEGCLLYGRHAAR